MNLSKNWFYASIKTPNAILIHMTPNTCKVRGEHSNRYRHTISHTDTCHISPHHAVKSWKSKTLNKVSHKLPTNVQPYGLNMNQLVTTFHSHTTCPNCIPSQTITYRVEIPWDPFCPTVTRAKKVKYQLSTVVQEHFMCCKVMIDQANHVLTVASEQHRFQG